MVQRFVFFCSHVGHARLVQTLVLDGCDDACMELGDILSPLASLVVGFFGALMGVRQSNAAWKREKAEQRIRALRNYERALNDMAMYLEGVHLEIQGHPEPKDLDEARRAAYPYFTEFDRSEYDRLLSPTPAPSTNAIVHSIKYADTAYIIKSRLDEEQSGKKKRIWRLRNAHPR